MQSITQTEQKIEKLSIRLKNLEENGGLRQLLNQRRLQKKLDKLNTKQFYQIDEYLSTNDNAYKTIIARNYELLKASKITFTVYSTGISSFGTYTKGIKGVIHPNGYSYSHSEKTNFAFIPFDSFKFPSEMRGKVDYWGRLSLKTTQTSYLLFKSLPKKFYGFVDTNGYIQIDNIENEWELFSNGRRTIRKMIANHFEYDDYKAEQFYNNKLILSNQVYQFWDELKSDLQMQHIQ